MWVFQLGFGLTAFASEMRWPFKNQVARISMGKRKNSHIHTWVAISREGLLPVVDSESRDRIEELIWR